MNKTAKLCMFGLVSLLATLALVTCIPGPNGIDENSVAVNVRLSWFHGTTPVSLPQSISTLQIQAISPLGDSVTVFVPPTDTQAVVLSVPEGFSGTVSVTAMDASGIPIYAGTLAGVATAGPSLDITVPCYPLPPLASGTFKAASITYKSVRFVWEDNSSNEESYLVYRVGPDGPKHINLPGNTTGYLDTLIQPNASYIYVLFGMNTAGASKGDSLAVSVPAFVEGLSAGPDTVVGPGAMVVFGGTGKSAPGAVDSANWSFAGGNPVSQAGTTIHNFNALAPQPLGSYPAILTATSDNGHVAADTAWVHVRSAHLRGVASLQDLPGNYPILVSIFAENNAVLDTFRVASGSAFVRSPLSLLGKRVTATYHGFKSSTQALAVPTPDTVDLALPLFLLDTLPPTISNLGGATSIRFGTPVAFHASATDPPYAAPPTTEWDFHGKGIFVPVLSSPHTHMFSDTGMFACSYRATDTHGNESIGVRTITVLPPAVRVIDTSETTAVVAWSPYMGSDFVAYQVINLATGAAIYQGLTATDTTATLSGLTRNTSYALRMMWTHGTVSRSKDLSVKTRSVVSPVLSSANVQPSSLSLQWTPYAGDGFRSYRVMRYTSGHYGASYSIQGSEITSKQTVTKTITGLSSNTQYKYLLQTRLASPADTLASNLVTVTTAGRTSPVLAKGTTTASSVGLSWTKYTADGFQAYRVLRYVANPYGGSFVIQGSEITSVNTTQKTVTGLSGGTTHRFKLQTRLSNPTQTLTSNEVQAQTK